eukprot:CAMPEP_0202685508 /NCGR_PEP_ID=MMETSP1385-20130828/1295_1 /ASSEMBLY_ACC=CAM_ASM_000861 /TAXON_ID=933848 /ORGANISM="Elphidium margaritaceum" /LENGTH=575 /DNA_ID=CAMNT_0049339879 /DNA_START=110 /DNA_END=1838 /DNA_ORIENTATION=+
MATNRDLSIAVIETFGSQCESALRLFEGLSASGIRTCRYLSELSPSLVAHIHANDIDKGACAQIERNLALNHSELEIDSKVCLTNADCNLILRQHAMNEMEHFDVIDIDPYGSCVPFLNASFAAINDGGLLCLTCTDLSILCGNDAHAAFRKYASLPIHDKIMHEHAIRMILHRVANVATLNECSVEPLLSMFCDYYIRIFVRVRKSKNSSNQLSLNLADVYYCYKCSIWKTQPLVERNSKHDNVARSTSTSTSTSTSSSTGVARITAATVHDDCVHCVLCKSKNKKFGPIWSGHLYNEAFVGKLVETLRQRFSYVPTHDRLLGKLLIIQRECKLNHVPYFVHHNYFALKVSTACPQMKNAVFRSVLENAGYQWSLSHCTPDATKTDAPFTFICRVVKEWLIKHDINAQSVRVQNNVIAQKLLSGNAALPSDDTIIDFSLTKNAKDANKEKLFKMTPKNWGPKKAASSSKNKASNCSEMDVDDTDNKDNMSPTITVKHVCVAPPLTEREGAAEAEAEAEAAHGDEDEDEAEAEAEAERLSKMECANGGYQDTADLNSADSSTRRKISMTHKLEWV